MTSTDPNSADLEPVEMDEMDELARAIGDPGSVVPRLDGETTTRWAARAVAAVLNPACDMTHTPPMDFASCSTHDTTFALGGTCRFDGRQPWAVFADEADEQRGLKVRAQFELEAMTDAVDAVRAVHPRGPASSRLSGEPATGDIEDACTSCRVAWPCPTVETMTTYLGPESVPGPAAAVERRVVCDACGQIHGLFHKDCPGSWVTETRIVTAWRAA